MAEWHRIKRWLLARDWPFICLGLLLAFALYVAAGCEPAPPYQLERSSANSADTSSTPHADDTGAPTASEMGFLPTPTTQDAANNGGPSQSGRNTPPLNAVVGGSLNPQWVEWLMGFPPGWTDLEHSETQVVPQVVEQLGRAVMASQ